LAGVVPKVALSNHAEETAIVLPMEKIEAEVGADASRKALLSAPEVGARITELKNCLQQLANAVMALEDTQRHPRPAGVAEQAAILLKNRLELLTNQMRMGMTM
jgi:hypothetical protein